MRNRPNGREEPPSSSKVKTRIVDLERAGLIWLHLPAADLLGTIATLHEQDYISLADAVRRICNFAELCAPTQAAMPS